MLLTTDERDEFMRKREIHEIRDTFVCQSVEALPYINNSISKSMTCRGGSRNFESGKSKRVPGKKGLGNRRTL